MPPILHIKVCLRVLSVLLQMWKSIKTSFVAFEAACSQMNSTVLTLSG